MPLHLCSVVWPSYNDFLVTTTIGHVRVNTWPANHAGLARPGKSSMPRIFKIAHYPESIYAPALTYLARDLATLPQSISPRYLVSQFETQKLRQLDLRHGRKDIISVSSLAMRISGQPTFARLCHPPALVRHGEACSICGHS